MKYISIRKHATSLLPVRKKKKKKEGDSGKEYHDVCFKTAELFYSTVCRNA